MMTWTDGATWVGTIVSLIAGYFAWRQAQDAKAKAESAKESATLAEQMRDDIAKRKAHSELSGLNGALGAAIRAMDKYGPGAGPNIRRGYSPDSDAAAVRAVTVEMKRLQALLVEAFGHDVDDVINKVNQLLVCFAAASDDNQRVERGRDIYNELVEFSGNIKKELDGNIYS